MAKIKKVIFNIIGMHCQSCVVNIENFLKKESGVVSANVNLANEKAYLEIDLQKTSIEKIKELIKKAGYLAQEETEETHDHHQMEKEKDIKRLRNRFVLSLIFGLPIFYLTMGKMAGLPLPNFTEMQSTIIQFVLAALVIISAFNIWSSGAKAILRLNPNMDSLIFLGTFTAFVYSAAIAIFLFLGKEINSPIYFESAALILVFISLGNYLEAITKGKTSQAIKKLIGLVPKETIVVKNGQEIKTPISQVQTGDIILVKPGEKIPVDGLIIEGHSFVDEAMITGEPIAKEKTIGNEVIGGTINKNGVLKFKATRVGKDTMLSQIIKMVESAMGSKAPIQALADKVSFYFVPTVLGIAVLALSVWLILGYSLPFALKAFVAVLVIACPCALGLATPTVIMMATGLAASKGILIKNARALEMAQKIDVVVFDKTGTLTKGNTVVTDVFFVSPSNSRNLLQLAGSAEKNSEHPLAQAVLNKCKAEKVELLQASNFKIIEGKGVRANLDFNGNNTEVLLGNRKLMQENSVLVEAGSKKKIEELETQGKTVVLLSADKKFIGAIAIADTLKDHSKEAVVALQKTGKKVGIITGDNQRVGKAIAVELGVDFVLAEVLPQDKANEIKKLQESGKKVAMVGDGINDAPALAQGDLGIALGSGTDIVMETGDIVLVKDNLKDVILAMALSKYTFKKIKQNLVWAFGYNTLGIPIAAGVLYPLFGLLLSPAIAALAMAFSSVSVVLNSLSMKRKSF
ncbi:MAG: heavy metal translocating P-type ATPase [Candidatus Pacebacteria bacterium]|nr:heavy metal translocating P-type ATPase [Candidatus Paceibacterota bacterium]